MNSAKKLRRIDNQSARLNTINDRQQQEDEETIDLGEFFALIKKHALALILLVAIGAALAGIGSALFIPKTYASSGTLFLTPRVSEGKVDIESLNSNQKLVNNVVNLLTQDNIMSQVALDTEMPSAKDVRDTLKIENIPDTEIITVTSTTTDPKLSKAIVEDTIHSFIDTMQENLNVKNIEITNTPKLDYEPVGPSIKKNTVIGAAAGLVLGLGWMFLLLITDKRLKTREEVEKYIGLPVYAELPDLESSGKLNKRKN